MKLLLPHLLLLLSLSAYAGDLSAVDALLAKGKEEAKACRAWERDWEKLNPIFQGDDIPSHRNKDEAMQVLALLERRPGQPLSFAAAAKALREMAAAEMSPTVARQTAILERFRAVEAECQMLSTLQLRLLYKDIDAFHLDAGVRKRILDVARNFLLVKEPFSSFLGAALRGVVLEDEAKYAAPKDRREEIMQAAQDYQTDFEGRRLLLSARWKEHGASKEHMLEDHEYEWALTEGMWRKYQRLLKVVAPFPDSP